jgi:uncharacterized protein (DUF433 family)
MTDEDLRTRIVIDPRVMVGKPCIRGTRIPVRTIVNLLAHGATSEEILGEYPRLAREDILACLLYAADILECRSSVAVTAERDTQFSMAGAVDRGHQRV